MNEWGEGPTGKRGHDLLQGRLRLSLCPEPHPATTVRALDGVGRSPLTFTPYLLLLVDLGCTEVCLSRSTSNKVHPEGDNPPCPVDLVETTTRITSCV